ncbi:hypothetical protein JQN72_09040 [Phycicoccus sp. CSK15P-2]|uniref:hypothetical protein n=1 Tax=Phycicoccus sp. CSK15P-2 TaxID=2807627 RepID=UPI001950CD5C|nr:hypothetical protein [Phycicoccus sp. CSK15P-2]MBM6404383.1 hypothetical protein [Phycicoccus sp. CSK15P-2]
MSLVPGDPASLSSCAASTAATAERVAATAAALEASWSALAQDWPGRASVEPRRRGDAVVAASSSTADELGSVARALQDQATDLAGLVARARTVEERAAAAGLEVRDDRVVPAYGRVTTADAAAESARAATAATLQAELDLVLSQHRRRRDFLLGMLRASTGRLAEVSAGLRA